MMLKDWTDIAKTGKPSDQWLPFNPTQPKAMHYGTPSEYKFIEKLALYQFLETIYLQEGARFN